MSDMKSSAYLSGNNQNMIKIDRLLLCETFISDFNKHNSLIEGYHLKKIQRTQAEIVLPCM